MSMAARILLALIRAYQFTFSALMGKQCRFYPSCSHYAAEAIRRHGALAGGWMGLRRILRCHPWNPGGVDLVPEMRPQGWGGRGKFFSEKPCNCATHAARAASGEVPPPEGAAPLSGAGPEPES